MTPNKTPRGKTLALTETPTSNKQGSTKPPTIMSSADKEKMSWNKNQSDGPSVQNKYEPTRRCEEI